MEETSDLTGAYVKSEQQDQPRNTYRNLDDPDTLLFLDGDGLVIQRCEGNDNVLDGTAVNISWIQFVVRLLVELVVTLKTVQRRIDGSFVRDGGFCTRSRRSMGVANVRSRALLGRGGASEHLFDRRANSTATARVLGFGVRSGSRRSRRVVGRDCSFGLGMVIVVRTRTKGNQMRINGKNQDEIVLEKERLDRLCGNDERVYSRPQRPP